MVILSTIEQGGGNKQTPPIDDIPKCSFQAKNWVMTWNNYPDNIFELLEQTICPLCLKYVFGKEVGAEGTPHIQGAFVLKSKKRQDTLWNIMGDVMYLNKMQGRWNDQKYCIKDGNYISNVKLPSPLVKITKNMLREEQKNIADLFTEREDPLFGRKIFWFWEPIGNWGKSVLTTYMIDQMDATEVSGKNADVLCGIASLVEKTGECPPIVIYDIPRCNHGAVSYQSLEKLKDGKFFSGKYESGMVRFNKPHIICFANEPPETSKLSKDRWVIKNLRELEFYDSSDDEGSSMSLMNISP